MKLREMIRDIPDDDWLEIIERTMLNRRSYIGRVPKKYILGEVLDYDAVYLGENRSYKSFRIHQFLVKAPFLNPSSFET